MTIPIATSRIICLPIRFILPLAGCCKKLLFECLVGKRNHSLRHDGHDRKALNLVYDIVNIIVG